MKKLLNALLIVCITVTALPVVAALFLLFSGENKEEAQEPLPYWAWRR